VNGGAVRCDQRSARWVFGVKVYEPGCCRHCGVFGFGGFCSSRDASRAGGGAGVAGWCGGFGGDERRNNPTSLRSRALLPPAALFLSYAYALDSSRSSVGRLPSTSAESSERTREPLCWHVRATCSLQTPIENAQ